MVNWQDLAGLGYHSTKQSIYRPGIGQTSNFGSSFNNGFNQMHFSVNSFVPGKGPFVTNEKAQQFANDQFLPVLASLGRAGAFDVPSLGLGSYLNDSNRFQIPPDFASAWGNFFKSPLNFRFPPAYTTK